MAQYKDMMRSHIIPKFYLEQFATPSTGGKDKPGRIWVYEKGRSPHQRSTSVQGAENGYFGFVRPDGSLEESLETYLADREREWGDVLISVKSELFDWTSASSRNKIAFYAALLFSRATQRRTFSARNWADIQKGFTGLVNDDNYISDLATHYAKRYKEATPTATRNRLRKLVEDMKSESAAKNIFLSDLTENTEFIKSVLLEKPWYVWKVPLGGEFVTSDNPLITFIAVGNGEFAPGHRFGVPGVVAAFPLAPNAALMMGISAKAQSYAVNTAQVMKLNETIIRLCDRYVYSRLHSAEIGKMVDEYAGAARYGWAICFRADGNCRALVRIGSFFRAALVNNGGDAGIFAAHPRIRGPGGSSILRSVLLGQGKPANA
jgi:Protein of unknown function (DUF4238)